LEIGEGEDELRGGTSDGGDGGGVCFVEGGDEFLGQAFDRLGRL
jgi:hypothetical protein